MTVMEIFTAGNVAPSEIPVTGKRMAGALPVSYALTSALTRVVRFGGYRFGLGNIVTVNGIDHDIAALEVVEEHGRWVISSYGSIRRADTESVRDASQAATAAVNAWAIDTAAMLAEQHPDAFVDFGLSDRDDHYQYRTSTQMRDYAEKAALDVWLLTEYSQLAAEVDSGDATVIPVPAGRLTRWDTPSIRDLRINQLDAAQPAAVVGVIVTLDGEEIGLAVDARNGNHRNGADTRNGPLLIPIEHAREADLRR